MPKSIHFAIITHVLHNKEESHLSGYAPYIREMNIWFKYVDEVSIVAPLLKTGPTAINSVYEHEKINFVKIPTLNFTSFKKICSSLFKLPILLCRIFWTMKKADHIHLRCPGNIGLLGCLVQIFFPNKIKTAKYAGNWDPKSKQPWSYRLQKYILNNTFLTRNMQVLVYGNWEKQSKNIRPFFTATYSEAEKEIVEKPGFDTVLEFIFVGSLVSGKNPMYAVQLVEQLIKKGRKAVLNLYGEGIERNVLVDYIKKNKLGEYIILQGNQSKEVVTEAYKKSHFVVLPSKSEGWPKAIAEGMFWGCVPVATKVSCLPFMLDFGNRGILLEMDLEEDIAKIEGIITKEDVFFAISKLAADWSQQYTTSLFETEIAKLLVK
ncbi:glycosyltransferase [Flavobacterium poyangense]|uniref:glycosyltransferase n=1 Tax=Flavobacterium poyangense TaxID=2204302 RepID=UPI0027D29E92|nr:glycosyltransferase [Flavobacterium sp. JXAS1]